MQLHCTRRLCTPLQSLRLRQLRISAAACSGSLLALHALDLSLYSEALTAMAHMHELQDQLMALVYKLSWKVKRSIHLAEGYVCFAWGPHGDISSQTSSDDDLLETEPAVANGNAGNAAAQQSLDDQVCSCLCT